MLTDQDIQKLIAAQEEIFATKGDLEVMKEELRKDFSDLQVAVDGYAKKADTYFQEMLVLSRRVDRMESWMKEIAQKVGIELKF